LSIADVSDADEIAVGFKKIQAFDTTAITSAANTDFACLNVDNGDIKILSVLNSGTISSTDTTQDVADAGTVTLEVRVSEAGYVKYLVNGAAPTVDVTSFQFDADTLVPFVAVVADFASDPGVKLIEWESGLLTERGLDGVNDLTN
jgi:hypothetical protein